MRPLVVTGPTAAGKTDLALRLAARWGATLVSMDAMMVYRGMDVGTAKPSPEVLAAFPHRCVDVRDPDEAFSAAEFVAEAERAVGEGRPVILVGGTTFYLRAFLGGLVPAPAVDPALRATLEALPDPWEALRAVDPVLAARLHPHDRVRVVRGLEYHALTGEPLSAAHARHAAASEGDGSRGAATGRRDAVLVSVDRDDLYERIDARVGAMMGEGYLDEVRGLLAAGYGRELKPMRSLGYAHLAAHLAGELDLDEAVRLTHRDTRHFARKQRTFLRGLGLSPEADPDRRAEEAFTR